MNRFTKFSLATVFGLAAVSAQGAALFSEGFGTIANGTTLTTTNTSFTYARASSGATPTLQAINPGSFTGAAGLIGATTTSLTGLGVLSGTYAAFDVGTFSLNLMTPANTAGTLFLAAGTGTTTFTNNTTFTSNDLAFGIQLTGGALQSRAAGAFTTFGSALAASTAYSIQIDFNNSATAALYTGGSLATKTADVYVNGVLVGDDIAIQGSQSVTGFRAYTVSDPAGNAFQLDDVALFNVANAAPTPEPSTYVMMVAGLGLLMVGQRASRRLRHA